MNVKAKKRLPRVISFAIGTVLIAVVAAPAVSLSMAMDASAREAQQKQASDESIDSMLAKDPKFEAISGRLFLDNDTFKPSLQASSLDKKYAKEAQWFPYQVLPAYQSLMNDAMQADKTDQRQFDNKVKAKAAALTEAKGVCDLTKKSPIEEVGAAARNGETNLWNPKVRANLPVYLEYCDATDEYKAAIMNATRFAKGPKDYKEHWGLDTKEYVV